MFLNPFDSGSVSLSIVGGTGSTVITRNFVGDIGREVGRRCGLCFCE